jgi:hypothetical protein
MTPDPLWIKSTCNELTRDAIWQYMMDHAHPTRFGTYKGYFELKDRADFWRRVEQRFNGNYHKREITTLEIKRKARSGRLGFVKGLALKVLEL